MVSLHDEKQAVLSKKGQPYAKWQPREMCAFRCNVHSTAPFVKSVRQLKCDAEVASKRDSLKKYLLPAISATALTSSYQPQYPP